MPGQPAREHTACARLAALGRNPSAPAPAPAMRRGPALQHQHQTRALPFALRTPPAGAAPGCWISRLLERPTPPPARSASAPSGPNWSARQSAVAARRRHGRPSARPGGGRRPARARPMRLPLRWRGAGPPPPPGAPPPVTRPRARPSAPRPHCAERIRRVPHPTPHRQTPGAPRLARATPRLPADAVIKLPLKLPPPRRRARRRAGPASPMHGRRTAARRAAACRVLKRQTPDPASCCHARRRHARRVARASPLSPCPLLLGSRPWNPISLPQPSAACALRVARGLALGAAGPASPSRWPQQLRPALQSRRRRPCLHPAPLMSLLRSLNHTAALPAPALLRDTDTARSPAAQPPCCRQHLPCTPALVIPICLSLGAGHPG
jgi:hypothetical protein